jgi:hypothetical protein
VSLIIVDASKILLVVSDATQPVFPYFYWIITTQVDCYINHIMEIAMNNVHCIKTAFLLVVLITFIGCKSKQDKSATNAGAPQEKAAVPAAVSPQIKSGAAVVPPQDKADAQAAAVRVLTLMETGDFPAIYKDSAAGFKQIGSENQFVAKFQQTRKSVGVLKNPKETSFGIIPGKAYVLVYRVENETYKSDIRLSFARSQSGKMELAGLNQHDELKK